MRSSVLALTLIVAFAPALAFAQQVEPLPAVSQQPGVVPDSYIVEFADRSFTLDRYREAIYSQASADQVAAIVADMEARVLIDQKDFVADVLALGGKVENQWWLINAACVSVPPGKLAQVQALPNVRRVSPNRIHHAVINTARDGNHHNAAAANLKRDKANVLVRGRSLGVAVLDTGQDANMAGSGRPHRAYFPGGNPSNQTGGGLSGSFLKAVFGTSGYGTEDAHGHGTFCAGCVGANQFPFAGADGMAPDAWIVGIKISDNSGSAASNWLISGWQTVSAQKVAHNIRVANNSFSGSPDINDPIQQALDTCAYSSDVLITVAAGNSGTGGTASSQSGYNGIAVGSINKNSLAWSSFSSVGPLSGYGTGRTYPDIAAVGASVNSTAPDTESSYSNASGTSFASPMVAGIAALVRQAGGAAMTALETRAILLNNTNNSDNGELGSPNTAYRNQKGLGVSRADWAVDAALAGDVQKGTLSGATKVRNYSFPATQGLRKNVTVAWMRQNAGTAWNVDLRIYDPNNVLVGSDLQVWNSYAKVTFTPPATGTYRAEVTWNTLSPGAATVDFAISGVGRLASGPPTLTAINPGSVRTYEAPPVEITLTGTNLDSTTKILVGGSTITSFSILSATQVKFTAPVPFPIGVQNVTVDNGGGISNPLQLTVDGVHPGIMQGSNVAARGYPAGYKFYSDKNWQVLLFVSPSNQPSSLPGFVNLGIGNAFSSLYYFGTVPCDASGYSALTITYPTTMPSLAIYWQGVPFDPLNVTTPFDTTNVHLVNVF